MRDAAVKAGSSTIEVKDGVVNISDVVTFWRPTGEEPPAYRQVVSIVKIMNVNFNLDLRFATKEWDGAPLIPDKQSVTNPKAKKPMHVKSVIKDVIKGLGEAAILSDPETAKKTVSASIDSQNPNRLNGQFTGQLSGNTDIISLDFFFGFYFGTPAAA
jgi:phage tail sheath gpL-like